MHPRSKAQLENYLKRPTHGLLLVGEKGIGKTYVAQWVVEVLGAEASYIKVPEDKKTISIAQIRELYTLTRTGGDFVVIIEDSHRMGVEAQNAFLKLLEEPPKNTRFILTAANQNALLETIRSRTQSVQLLPPAPDLLASQPGLPDDPHKNALIHTTERLPGKLDAVSKNPDERAAHQAAVDEAKHFFGSTQYQRHLICIEHGYKQDWAEELLRMLGLITESLLKNTGATNRARSLQQSSLIEETATRIIAYPGNPKIHLARLCALL